MEKVKTERCSETRSSVDYYRVPDAEKQPAEFETKLEEIKQQFNRWNGEDILNRHRIGCLVSKIKDSPTYGSKAIPRLVRELDVKKSWLYETATVAETWTEEELEQLLKRKDSKRGRPLNWSHFAKIARFSDPGERGNWLEKVLDQGLSAREIETERTEESEPLDDIDPSDAVGSKELRLWMIDVNARSEAITQSCETLRSIMRRGGGSAIQVKDSPEELERTLDRIREAKGALDEAIAGLEGIIPNESIPA